MSRSIKHLLQESFAPVLGLVLGFFLVLFYIEHRTLRESDSVTVIRIELTQPFIGTMAEDTSLEDDTPQLSLVENSDPKYAQAAALVDRGRWEEAEARYRALTASKPSSQALNDFGVLYLRKDEPARALKLFNRALLTEPAYARAFFNRALAFSRLGKTEKAIADYRSLTQVLPHHFESHFNMGLLLLERRDYAEAAKVFKRAAELAGGTRKARAKYSLGMAYDELGEPEKARSAFTDAVRLSPTYLRPRFALAAMEDDTADGRARALDQYEKVLALRPDYAPAHFNIALLHSAAGHFSEAEKSYRTALRYDPEYKKAHYNLGLLMLDQGRFPEARREFALLVKRDASDAESHFNLGRAAFGEHDYDTAISEYKLAIEARPRGYSEAQVNLGLTYAAQGRHVAAEAAYKEALKSEPASPQAWYNLALALIRRDRREEAIASLETAVTHDSAYAEAWYNLGVLYARDGREDKAIAAYRKALDIRPHYPEARLNLAVRYAKIDRYIQAVEEYRALLDEDDTYSLAWRNLGFAYLALGKPGDSEAAFRRALELEPNNLRALKGLAKSLAAQGEHEMSAEVLNQAIGVDTTDSKLRFRRARALRAAGRTEEARNELVKALRLDPDNKKLQRALNGIDSN